jgi:hypothetical protein
MAEGITTEGAVIEVNTGTSGSPVWTPIVERSQLRVPKTGETIDMTSFDDEGFRGVRPGLRQMQFEANGNYVPSNAGYQALETAWIDGAYLDIRAMWRTSAPGVTPATYRGWRGASSVLTDFGEGGNVGDKVELSLNLTVSGRPEIVTV